MTLQGCASYCSKYYPPHKDYPPLSLYGDCGAKPIADLAEGDTVADLVIQSNARKAELDKCAEAVKQLKKWSGISE